MELCSMEYQEFCRLSTLTESADEFLIVTLLIIVLLMKMQDLSKLTISPAEYLSPESRKTFMDFYTLAHNFEATMTLDTISMFIFFLRAIQVTRVIPAVHIIFLTLEKS